MESAHLSTDEDGGLLVSLGDAETRTTSHALQSVPPAIPQASVTRTPPVPETERRQLTGLCSGGINRVRQSVRSRRATRGSTRFPGHLCGGRAALPWAYRAIFGVRRRKVQGGNRQSSEGTSQSTARRPVGIALKIVLGYKCYLNAAHIANRVKKLSRHGSYSLHSLHSLGIALCLRVLARIRRRRSGVRPLSG